MKIKIVTLFPAMFDGFKGESIIKRTVEKGLVEIDIIDLRTYSTNKHHKVDDTPYGGGAGMILSCEVVHNCLQAIRTDKSHVVLMTPQGSVYKQNKAEELVKKEELILICGHYEGFDERIRYMVDEEISIGDYVLTGGELASMVISDSVIRLIEGAIVEDSHKGDSHSSGLLEYPQYTRPSSFNGYDVPEVLQNGNHKLINEWRKKESLRRTYLRRPDILKNYELNEQEQKMLEEIKKDIE